jgi:hypothetical protein
MKTVRITDLSPSLLDYVRGLGEDPAILTHDGEPVAVLFPVKDADMETVSLSFNPKFLAIIERSRDSLARGEGYSTEDIRREFGIPDPQKRKTKANHRKGSAKGRKSNPSSSSGEANGGKV